MDYFAAGKLAVTDGHKIARKGWRPGNFVAYHHPGQWEFMTIPYMYVDTVNVVTSNPATVKGRAPWSPSACDQAADDWYIIEDENRTTFTSESIMNHPRPAVFVTPMHEVADKEAANTVANFMARTFSKGVQ